jgi:putative DNA primase/helicase
MAERVHIFSALPSERGGAVDFINFCKSHGILISEHPPFGQWKRYPTEDHPRSRNGAVKYMGDHGFVQNHATSTVVSIWKPDSKEAAPSIHDLAKRQRQAEAETRKRQHDAVRRAVDMLNGSTTQTHPYLMNKGFKEEEGHVFYQGGQPILLIPMRISGSLVGVQQIDAEGTKRFLYGQKTAGAAFCFDNRGINVVCEGYATALSVRAALKSMKQRYKLHVCFSAGNMVRVAAGLERGIVIADNDQSGTGQQAAKEIGWPSWLSDVAGEDANDYHQRRGLFALSQSLTHLMLNVSTGG